MPELDIELNTTENVILYTNPDVSSPYHNETTIEGDRTEREIPNPWLLKIIGKGDERDILTLTVQVETLD